MRAHVADAARRVQGAGARVDRRRGAAAQRERQGAQARAARAGAVVVSGYTELRYDVDDHVAIITLDRPEARNALTFTTYAELTDAVATTKARCLVVTGRDPAFCSGDDVKQIMANAGAQVSSDLAAEPRITPAAKALLETDVPVIAAVNGAAVGWGMELAIMADIRVVLRAREVRRAVREAGLVLRRRGPGPARAAGRAGSGGRAPVHRARHRRRDGKGAAAGVARRPPRRVDGDRIVARARDRREPTARGPEAEGRTAHGRSTPTSTTSAVG